MKRDWELVRTILKRLEDAKPQSPVNSDSIEGYEGQIVAYHMEIMDEAGLIEAKIVHEMGGAGFGMALRLTWNGHEFLDAIKQDTVWNQVKQTALDKGIELTFNLVAELGARFLRTAIGLT